jgi:ABC-type uncharacterized transport system substrate-binding protein
MRMCLRTKACLWLGCCFLGIFLGEASIHAADIDMPKDKIYRVGYLDSGKNWSNSRLLKKFKGYLASKGWGKRIIIPTDATFRSGRDVKGKEDAKRFAAQLMQLPDLDCIIAVGTEASIALMAANNGRTPVIGLDLSDPVAAGLLKNNKEPVAENFVTAVIPTQYESMFRLFYKSMRFKKLGIINMDTPAGRGYSNIDDAREVAREQGFSLVEYNGLTDENSMAQCLEGVKYLVGKGVDAFFLSGLNCFNWRTNDPTPLISYLNERHVMTYARNGAPLVHLGALMGTSVEFFDRMAAFQAEQLIAVLRGEKLSRLPMVLPVQFGLTLNLETANRIGVDFSVELLVMADEIDVRSYSLDQVRDWY